MSSRYRQLAEAQAFIVTGNPPVAEDFQSGRTQALRKALHDIDVLKTAAGKDNLPYFV